MKKTIIILATVLLASFSSSIIAAGDAEAGQTKSATCMGCHGLAGNSEIASFPKLAGQGEIQDLTFRTPQGRARRQGVSDLA
jgi:cytochrome c553